MEQLNGKYQEENETMKTQLAKFEDKFKTCMRIKGEYEELITKLSENAFMKDKIVTTLAELDRART